MRFKLNMIYRYSSLLLYTALCYPFKASFSFDSLHLYFSTLIKIYYNEWAMKLEKCRWRQCHWRKMPSSTETQMYVLFICLWIINNPQNIVASRWCCTCLWLWRMCICDGKAICGSWCMPQYHNIYVLYILVINFILNQEKKNKTEAINKNLPAKHRLEKCDIELSAQNNSNSSLCTRVLLFVWIIIGTSATGDTIYHHYDDTVQ